MVAYYLCRAAEIILQKRHVDRWTTPHEGQRHRRRGDGNDVFLDLDANIFFEGEVS